MVALKHTIWKKGERIVHFYDGQLTAKDGVVDIPDDNEAWIRRAWILGYRLDTNDEPVTIADALSAKSTEEVSDAEKSSNRRRRATS